MGDLEDILDSQEEAALNTALKAIMAAVPALGGALNSVYNDIESREQMLRLIEFLEEMQEEIDVIKSQINKNTISESDFEDIFEENLRRIITTRNRDKRRYFANILKNSVTADNISYNRVAEFGRLVENLRKEHILILKILKDPSTYSEETGVHIDKNETPTSVNNIMKSLLPSWGESEILDVLHDLEDERLIKDMVARFNVQTTGRVIRVLGKPLTEKGEQFYNFVSRPLNSEKTS